MITIASQIHAARPPNQFGRSAALPREAPRRAGFVPVVSVVVTVATSYPLSCSLELTSAAADAPQEQGQREADDHEDGRDRARQAHLVALEPADVHVEGEVAGGVARSARGEH